MTSRRERRQNLRNFGQSKAQRAERVRAALAQTLAAYGGVPDWKREEARKALNKELGFHAIRKSK